VGTYSATGFADEHTTCGSCRGAKYLASKSCHLFGGVQERMGTAMGKVVKNTGAESAANAMLGIFVAVLVLVLGFFGLKQYRRHSERIEYEGDAADDMFGPESGCSYGSKSASFYEEKNDFRSKSQERNSIVEADDGGSVAGGSVAGASVAGSSYPEENDIEMIFEGIDSIPSRRDLQPSDSMFSISSDVAIR